MEQLQRQFVAIHSALVQPAGPVQLPAASAQLPRSRKLPLNQSQSLPLNAQLQGLPKGHETVGSSAQGVENKKEWQMSKQPAPNDDIQSPVEARHADLQV